MDILATIKASDEYRKLADAGLDSELSDLIQSNLPKPMPITAQMLATAAPKTMSAMADGSIPFSAAEKVASLLQDQDWTGLGAQANLLFMLGKMPQNEFEAVGVLAVAAVSEKITHNEVSDVLNAIRPRDIEITEPRVDDKGQPVLGDDGKQIADIIQHAGTVRALPIDWSKA